MRFSLSKRLIWLALGWLISVFASAEEDVSEILRDVPYQREKDSKDPKRHLLDVYLPKTKPDQELFPVVLWFHGGGLVAGDKAADQTPEVAKRLNAHGVAVVSANYRFSPRFPFPQYLQDAVGAFKWTLKEMPQWGGDPSKIFVGGHSAGAYMALMIGLDPSYLEAEGLKLEQIRGLIPVSPQTMTHYTIREERGLPKEVTIVDEAAPVFHAKKDAPPILLLCGEKDLPTRVEENLYFAAQNRALGHAHTDLLIIPDRTHLTIFTALSQEEDPGLRAILNFIYESP